MYKTFACVSVYPRSTQLLSVHLSKAGVGSLASLSHLDGLYVFLDDLDGHFYLFYYPCSKALCVKY